jgi:hypothetical protein
MAEPLTYLDFYYEPHDRCVVIAASIDKLGEANGHQLSLIKVYDPPAKRGGFGIRFVEGMLIRSLASNGSFLWAVGEQGEIWTYPAGKKVAIEDTLPDSGVRSARHLGRPERIRIIAGLPYICGYAGQVYTLSTGRWVHMDDGLAESEGTVNSIHLEGIHGTDHDDLYVVGSGGLLAHFDGRSWTRIKVLTTSFLGGVRAFSRDHVVAVGTEGVFIEWDGVDWTVDQIPHFDRTLLSDVEMFKGDIYVAAVGKLLVRKGGRWDEVRTRLDEPEFIRLTVGGGKLWAMGSKRIHSFDGLDWEAHIDPDNG